MDLNRQRENDLNEYVVQDKFKITFIVMSIVTLLLIFLDRIYYSTAMEWSISIAIELQKYDLTWIIWFFSTAVFGMMYIYIIVVYTLRKNQESNFSLLWGAFFMIYLSGVSKLIFLGHRPVFLSEQLNSNYCVCDYGKPSTYSLTGLGTLLLIYTDITTNAKFDKSTKLYMKIIFVIIQIGVSFSRLYIGVNSINQIILGLSIGFTAFCGIRRMNDYMLKFIIWPIFYKDRFKDKRAIFHILLHIMWTNYLLFSLWSYRYTTFDIPENEYFTFPNCKECLVNVGLNFSVEIASDAVWFNIYFGMLLGIYISRRLRFNHKGLYAEGDVRKYILRLMLLAVMVSPLIFAFIPVIQSVIITFVRKLFIAVLVGVLITNVYFNLLDYFGWTIEEVPHRDESCIDELNRTMTFKD